MTIRMESTRHIRRIIILLSVMVVMAMVADHLYFSDLEWKYRTSRLNNELINREKKADAMLKEMEAGLASGESSYFLNHDKVGISSSENDIILLIYTDTVISYWSDNSVTFPERYYSNFQTHNPVFISNGWFIPIHRKYLSHDLVALIGVYRDYSIKNNLLKSGFPKAFKLPESSKITFDKTASPFVVNGIEGEFHFGLIFPETKPNTLFILFPLFLWLIVLLLWLHFVRVITSWLTASDHRLPALIAALKDDSSNVVVAAARALAQIRLQAISDTAYPATGTTGVPTRTGSTSTRNRMNPTGLAGWLKSTRLMHPPPLSSTRHLGVSVMKAASVS